MTTRHADAVVVAVVAVMYIRGTITQEGRREKSKKGEVVAMTLTKSTHNGSGGRYPLYNASDEYLFLTIP